MRTSRHLLALLTALLLLSACAPFGSNNAAVTPGPTHKSTSTGIAACPVEMSSFVCRTPFDLRVVYGLQSLIKQGFTGKGQTVVDIVSYGSPTLQQDMDAFDRQFGLPPITIQIAPPLGTKPFNQQDSEMTGWAGETTLDVQIIHAIAPEAGIVVLTSPVDETEGTIGLPEFQKLEQYAVDHHLGYIFSQSWSASEATLADTAGQQEVTTYSDFYQKIITQQGYTVVSASGDNGATDFTDLAAKNLASTRTVGFPADVPWVTAVGGTTLDQTGSGYDETAWSGSGGGTRKLFAQPPFQKALRSDVPAPPGGARGPPPVAPHPRPGTGQG